MCSSGTMEQNGKTEAIVGFEPTGHYWFTLGDHLQDHVVFKLAGSMSFFPTLNEIIL